jgi:type IV secretion system protein VirB9
MRRIIAAALILSVAACASQYDLPSCPTGADAARYNPVAPAAVWDDGQSTSVLFQGNAPLPAVYFVDREGQEALAESTVTAQGGDHIITVHGTAPEIHFRKGRDVACVVNNAWNPAGLNPGTGTTSPGVVRIAR